MAGCRELVLGGRNPTSVGLGLEMNLKKVGLLNVFLLHLHRLIRRLFRLH
jgi:hypothetical protein